MTGMPGAQERPQDARRCLDEDLLVELLQGAWVAQAVHVAAVLGLADLLKYGPRSATDLANATRTHPRALLRLLRALAAVGVFEEGREDYYGLTALSQLLRSDVPESMHGVALAAGEPWSRRPWDELLHAVRTGNGAFEQAIGCSPASFFEAHPKAARLRKMARTALSRPAAEVLLGTYDYSWARRIVEIRGGKGSLVTSLLRGNPEARATVLDRPEDVRAIADHVASRGLDHRCEVVAGDMLGGVPPGGDLYLLRQIVSDLDDAGALAVLGHCRAAMLPEGHVLLVEGIIEGAESVSSRLVDLDLLVSGQGGAVRRRADICRLLEDAGFEVMRFQPTGTPYFLFEGIPR